MLGGELGGRFFTNGHWMALVDEDVWQAAVASGWRDVGARWSDYVRFFDCGASRARLADVEFEERYGASIAHVGSVSMHAEYHALLLELGADDVVITDHHGPMMLAPGIAFVSCMARNTQR